MLTNPPAKAYIMAVHAPEQKPRQHHLEHHQHKCRGDIEHVNRKNQYAVAQSQLDAGTPAATGIRLSTKPSTSISATSSPHRATHWVRSRRVCFFLLIRTLLSGPGQHLNQLFGGVELQRHLVGQADDHIAQQAAVPVVQRDHALLDAILIFAVELFMSTLSVVT